MDPKINLKEGADQQARSCSAEELTLLVSSAAEAVVLTALQNPHLTGAHLRLLLERRDLSASSLTKIAANKEWLREPGMRRALASHLHTPRPLAMTLARELEMMDLSAISLRTSVAPEVRRLADDLLIARIAQLPLGQRLTLARRGPGRVAAALLSNSDQRVVRAVLDNAHLTEGQLLRALSGGECSACAVELLAAHSKWSFLGTVRAALVRHSEAPIELVLALLPNLSLADLSQLNGDADLQPTLLKAVREELAGRAARQNRSSNSSRE